MENALTPGMTENDLWAILHAENIRRGGEWIETRLLASGPRTNPWFQECSARVIEAGDIVAFDTDLIGPYGYCCDISRTWLAGDGRPTNEQRALYAMAEEQIAANMEMLRPGRSFPRAVACRDERSGGLSRRTATRCSSTASASATSIPPCPTRRIGSAPAMTACSKPGMIVCVESYVGRHGGHEGVKLEEQVLITETGYEQLSRYPRDVRLGSARLMPALRRSAARARRSARNPTRRRRRVQSRRSACRARRGHRIGDRVLRLRARIAPTSLSSRSTAVMKGRPGRSGVCPMTFRRDTASGS